MIRFQNLEKPMRHKAKATKNILICLLLACRCYELKIAADFFKKTFKIFGITFFRTEIYFGDQMKLKKVPMIDVQLCLKIHQF